MLRAAHSAGQSLQRPGLGASPRLATHKGRRGSSSAAGWQGDISQCRQTTGSKYLQMHAQSADSIMGPCALKNEAKELVRSRLTHQQLLGRKMLLNCAQAKLTCVLLKVLHGATCVWVGLGAWLEHLHSSMLSSHGKLHTLLTMQGQWPFEESHRLAPHVSESSTTIPSVSEFNDRPCNMPQVVG